MNMRERLPNPNVGMLPPGIVCLITSKKLWRQFVERLDVKYDGATTLCSQKHEEDQLQREYQTRILKWTISSMLLFLQMQVLVPRLEGVLVTHDMPGVIHSNRMSLDVHN